MKIKSFYTTYPAYEGGAFIDALASLGRQVFVGISNNYPLKRFENDKVQLV